MKLSTVLETFNRRVLTSLIIQPINLLIDAFGKLIIFLNNLTVQRIGINIFHILISCIISHSPLYFLYTLIVRSLIEFQE